MPNRLIAETSPYLVQHAHNPVDWYPWGEEALARARAEDRPILLSIGYAACHWCHVMERESFEDPHIAAIMNAHFVNVKVDREERPDLDAVYMQAVQAMTGQGGWPMTVFLTPDGRPFFGGTYFPPDDRYGRPGFPRLLHGIADAWRDRRDQLEEGATALLAELDRMVHPTSAEGDLDPTVLERAYVGLQRTYDGQQGGFGHAPKFPPAMSLEFLMRLGWAHPTPRPAAQAMVEFTLAKMAQGGLYDHLGGGFHRYSTDAEWRVPHFEKMLYDNALLARLYVLAHQATGSPDHARVARETLDYVRREMTSPEGGFYATQDADSEGEEGKFFAWTPAQLAEVLGADRGARFARAYEVTDDGTFEHGTSVLHRAGAWDPALEADRRALFEVRERRIKPARDEKVVTSWNGLMLRAFADAGRTFDDAGYLAVAEANAQFLLDQLRPGGRLKRTWKDGVAKVEAFLEDHAALADGLLALYEATFDVRWFRAARELADEILDRFHTPAEGFSDTSARHESLVLRPRDLFDNATPSGASIAVDVLLRLALLTGEDRYRQPAVASLLATQDLMARYPGGFGRALGNLEFALAEPQEVALVGPRSEAMRQVVFGAYRPHLVAAGGEDGGTVALLADRPARGGQATAYVCRGTACLAPTQDPAELARQLTEGASAP